MKEYLIRMIVCIIILGAQYVLSKRKQFIVLLILPITSLLGGMVYLVRSDVGINLNNLVPFLVVSTCLLIVGLLERNKYKKKELEKMKKCDAFYIR